MTSVEITGKTLTIEEVLSVAYNRATLKPLREETRERMNATQAWLEDAINNKETAFYGINTGFGSHSNETISPDQAGTLSRNVILADVAGVGRPLPKKIVRAMMVIRANTIAGGPSGIRPVVVETLINMLNKDVIPYVPAKDHWVPAAICCRWLPSQSSQLATLMGEGIAARPGTKES